VSDPTIHRLFVGHVRGPIGELPIYAYAIRTGPHVLMIDTGMSWPPNPEMMKVYPMYTRPIEGVLADHGLTVGDITHVAMTHMDHDHSANNVRFRHVPVFIRAAELEGARLSHGAEFRETWDGDDVDFRVVDGDLEILPGVTAIATPGHTAGHQSFLVRRGDSFDLIVGDAAYNHDIYRNAETYTPDHPVWPIQVRTDRETWLGTIQRLRALDARQLHFSHDDLVWPQRPAAANAG
jgi:glyoxylase-like metal-dependent hydrolase (beta-lactamase superfamily II)